MPNFISRLFKRAEKAPEINKRSIIKKKEKTIIKKEKSYLEKEVEEIEKYSEFLKDFGDNIEQKRGVVSDSNRILVLAGAGSGKTKVLTKRVVHLIKNKNISKDNVLAITFTKAAAKEMRDRAANLLDINPDFLKKNVRTFHSFCLSILKQNEQFDVFSEKDQRDLIEKIIFNFKDNEEIMDSMYNYIRDNLIEKIRDKENEASDEEQVKDKPNQFGKKLIRTNSGELVKSKSERDIANFLTELGISWEYEKNVNFGEGDFKPDFFLGDGIYIEHWCYNKNSIEIPQINKKSYLEHREWKTNQYQKYGVKLISIEENEMLDLNKLQIRLKNELEKLLKRSFEKKEIMELLKLSPSYKKAYDKFIDEVLEIINLAKSRLLEVNDIKKLVKSEKKEKVISFYNVLIPVLESYEEITTSLDFGKKDFNDLIKDAVKLLKNNKERREYYQNRIKYLLVDEFQDVSYGEVELLKLLITKDTSFFAVGDDWQSIYGWRGSDVSYILKFEENFGKTEKIILPYNYRSVKNIVDASSHFIQKSKNQYKKDIKCSLENENDSTKILQLNSSNDFNGARYVIHKINELKNKEKTLKLDDFLILIRSSRSLPLYKRIFDQEEFNIKVRTIHSSKGTEAKYVFVLGLKGGIYGFPNIYADKDIKRVILDIPIEDKEDEERRIFYVAMTRAKKRLFLISEDGNESEFLADIPEEYKFIYDGKKRSIENIKE